MSGWSADGDAVEALLIELGRRLHERGLVAELYVVGGSAMALAYDGRRVTRDVDALFRPRDEVLAVAAQMAEDEGLPADWLNDAVRTVMPLEPDDGPADVLEAPGVRVSVASPEYLLAMKCMTTRQSRGDLDDAAFLAVLTDNADEQKLARVVQRYFGSSPLGATELFLERIVDQAGRLRASTAEDASAPPSAPGQRCDRYLPRARRSCVLRAGHGGQHR